MEVRPFDFGSEEYRAALVLRDRFLRAPLGLRLTEHDTVGEEDQHHYGLFTLEASGDCLIGALIGKPLPDEGDDVVQLRQVVIEETWRGRGAGRSLMIGAEAKLAALGYLRFVLYAREEAAPFYVKFGYERTGQTRELIGLEHWRMEKRCG